jgi:polyisoprenoid-binding protein YceI
MKGLTLAAAAAGWFCLAPNLVLASTWEIDPSHSSVEFQVRHLMVTTVKGSFEKLKGTIELNDKDITKSSVDVTVETASVNTHEPRRDGHLRSADFFDAEKFPVATFKSTKVERAGKDKLKVTGDLTIHGVRKPVVLMVDGPSAALKDPFGRTVRGLSAKGKLNRKDYGINWNKTLDAGGVMVGDEVKLEISAELAEKTAPAAAEANKAEPARQ